MRIPLSWLKEFVDVEAPAGEIAERLTFSGTEVEDIEVVGGGAEQVVVAQVTAVEPLPDDPRLRVCEVEAGGERRLRVVCGAPDVRVGGKYFLVKAGGRLPTGRRIGAEKFGGVESEGMLCAEDELGLSDDHSGLLEVEGDWAPGTPLERVMPPEPVFKVEVTPNRGDCLSVLGIAREVSALYGVPVRLPPADPLAEEEPPVTEYVRVEIEDPGDCPRYTARVLLGLQPGPSPFWMRRRLRLCGLRPISNMVDVTNYVLLECGHPLHAFDLDRLEGGEIRVRRARGGEKIVTIDGVERELDAEVLVIADGRGPVAVAGIMGGQATEIGPETRRVLLESAGFDPVRIRRGTKRLRLASESSYRFERHVDVARVEWASRRAAYLAQRVCGVKAARGVMDVYPRPARPRVVSCRGERVRQLTGIEADDGEIAAVFRALGMQVTREGQELRVTVPTHRADVTAEVDLVEEFARIYGLDRIPTHPPAVPMVGEEASRFDGLERLRRALVGLGLQEAMNYSLVSAELLDELDPDPASRRVRLKNPLSAEQEVLRTSLLPQMVESLALNASRQAAAAALFEIGKVFRGAAEGAVAEEEHVAVGLWGPVGRGVFEQRRPVTPEEAFLRVKGVVEGLLRAMGIREWKVASVDSPVFRRGMGVEISVGEERAGVMGILRPDAAEKRRLAPPPALAELRAEILLRGAESPAAYEPPPQYPGVRRDISFIVAESVKHEDVVRVIENAGPPELARVEVFDIFYSERLGRGKKSMAYSLEYRSRERTLTDEEVNEWLRAAAEALRKELGAVIREGPETA